MADIWLPGYTRVDLGASVAGGVYDDTSRPKLCWHSTEGRTITAARNAFRAYPPHVCYDPVTDQAEQYVPLGRHSYAFRQSENDDEFVVQVEIVGFAAQSHLWGDDILRRLAHRVVVPIRAAVGVPDVVIRTGFHGEGEGIILARENSPIRIGPAELRTFAGHLGHQHLPGEGHWDPGRLPIHKILTYSQEADVALTDDDIRRIWHYPSPNPDQPGSTPAKDLAYYAAKYAGLGVDDEGKIVPRLDAIGAAVAEIREVVVGDTAGDVAVTDDQLARVLTRPEVVKAYAAALADEQDRRARDGYATTGPAS